MLNEGSSKPLLKIRSEDLFSTIKLKKTKLVQSNVNPEIVANNTMKTMQ